MVVFFSWISPVMIFLSDENTPLDPNEVVSKCDRSFPFTVSGYRPPSFPVILQTPIDARAPSFAGRTSRGKLFSFGLEPYVTFFCCFFSIFYISLRPCTYCYFYSLLWLTPFAATLRSTQSKRWSFPLFGIIRVLVPKRNLVGGVVFLH